MSGNYIVDSNNKFPIKAWTKGVQVEDVAADQLRNMANMPFIHKHIAVMPDVHWGMGATIGSVVPTKGAIIPAAVGVDIGCGMMAVQTDFPASRLPDNLKELRGAIERAVPHGRTHHGGANDRGAWHDVPDRIGQAWSSTELEARYDIITEKHPKARSRNNVRHLGTLGTGNHFIEVCLDEDDLVWVMLHSGSRGCGNRIGAYFIQRAKKEMERGFIQLPDMNLAYLTEGSDLFRDYVEAVGWAQDFAAENRRQMMKAIVLAMENVLGPLDTAADKAVDCHHNYVIQENHYGSKVWLTRKGAVRACMGELGIIPGSMGARSYIVRGKGNPESFHSCAHGAGRAMSRREAKMKFSIEDHVKATEGVECRKDEGVIDETPMAYKDIDAVMRAQEDLVEIVHTLKQVVCVKG